MKCLSGVNVEVFKRICSCLTLACWWSITLTSTCANYQWQLHGISLSRVIIIWQDRFNTHPPPQPQSTGTQVKSLEGALWHLLENMWGGLCGWVGDWLVPVFTTTPRFNFSLICTLSGQAAFFARPWSFAFRERRRRDLVGPASMRCARLKLLPGFLLHPPSQTFQRVEHRNCGARQQ